MARPYIKQRVYDSMAGWCEYSKPELDPTPAATETTPNHTNNITVGSHEVIGEVPHPLEGGITLTASEYGTPVVSGTVPNSINVSVGGGAIVGALNDGVLVSVDTVGNDTVIIIPIEGIPDLPERFRIQYSFTNGAAPPVEYRGGWAFQNAARTRSWSTNHVITSVPGPGEMDWAEVDGSPGLSWDLPDVGLFANNYTETILDFQRPPGGLTDPPRIQADFACRGDAVSGTDVLSNAKGLNPSSGTLNAGWVGDEPTKLAFFLTFAVAHAGIITPQTYCTLSPHPLDL